MTVTYTAEVATCKKFGCFLALLFRWRGSIYKLVWMDLLVFIVVYYLLSFFYRYALNPQQQSQFEHIVHYFESYSALIPLSFVLGFFVQIVMTRWWEQYSNIPWPDPIAVFVSAHIHGQDDRARLMRRTIMRYVCLTQAIVFSLIAPRVKKRFPTLQSLVDVGLMLDNEKQIFESMDESSPKIPKYWMPIVWAASIVTRARKEGRIRDDFAVKTIVDELNKFRGGCGTLLIYDLVPIPLVYTQVVTVAVYSFFLGCVLGMQWTHSADKKHNFASVEFYVPVFTILQFFFYMGWLKVAESLINPFGEDDDDFEVNWMIDRNLQVSYLIVDEMHQEHPDLVKDQYWEEVFPSELPYGDGDIKREEPPEPSTTKLGERLAPISNVVVDDNRPIRIIPNDNVLRDVEQAEGRKELLKRMESLSSLPEVHKRSSPYTTAEESPLSKTVSKTNIDEPTTPQATVNFDLQESTSPKQRPEETPTTQRVKIKDAFYESSTESILDVPSDKTDILVFEPDSEGKDDFERLKEDRERERIERQRLRFVQHIEDVAQMTVKNEPIVSSEREPELVIEEEGEEEGEEEEVQVEVFEDAQESESKMK